MKLYTDCMQETDKQFSNTQPSVMIKSLDPNFGFAFNLSQPMGVKLLGSKLFDRLQVLLAGQQVPNLASELDRCLVAHRLITGVPIESPDAIDQKKSSIDFWIHLVNGCNLACYYCYIPRIKEETGSAGLEQLSFDVKNIEPTLSRLFAYCRQAGILHLGLKFVGGEPTLNMPLLEYFCSTAVRMKGDTQVKFGIISNGTFVNPDVIRVLSKFKFNISFSLDGCQSAHDRVRYQLMSDCSKAGTWLQIWRNVDQCLNAGLKPYLLYTVTDANVCDLPEFSEIAISKNIGYRIGLVRLADPPNRTVLEKITEALVSFYKSAGEYHPTKLPIERFARFSEWSLNRKKSYACSSGRDYFAIDQYGGVATCQMRLEKIYGNAAKEDFATIKKRVSDCEEHAVLTNPEMREGPCTRCEFTFVCSGGCPQHTKLSFGRFDHTSPWCYVYGKLLPSYVEAVAKQMLRRFYETQ